MYLVLIGHGSFRLADPLPDSSALDASAEASHVLNVLKPTPCSDTAKPHGTRSAASFNGPAENQKRPVHLRGTN